MVSPNLLVSNQSISSAKASGLLKRLRRCTGFPGTLLDAALSSVLYSSLPDSESGSANSRPIPQQKLILNCLVWPGLQLPPLDLTAEQLATRATCQLQCSITAAFDLLINLLIDLTIVWLGV